MVNRTYSWLVKKEDWLHEPPYLCRAPDKKNNYIRDEYTLIVAGSP